MPVCRLLVLLFVSQLQVRPKCALTAVRLKLPCGGEHPKEGSFAMLAVSTGKPTAVPDLSPEPTVKDQ